MTRRKALMSIAASALPALPAKAGQVPDRTVVLSFDDGVSSHATFVAPLLKKYKFPATFFVCEFPPDFADKHKYMTWEQIRGLYEMRFEIGNHTLTHKHVTRMPREQFAEELKALEERCSANGIPKPVSFAYPGYDTSAAALPLLKAHGYRFARAGLDRPYNPETDDPLIIPSYTVKGADKDSTIQALNRAQAGKIVVLTLHGIPDYAHEWVSVDPALFETLLNYLQEQKFQVLAIRDLAQYSSQLQSNGSTFITSTLDHSARTQIR